MEYEIVMAKEASELEEQVNEMIKEGWIPCGGVTISVVYNVDRYYQAMIKK